MHPSILDTDTLSEIIKGNNRRAVDRAADYLTEHDALAFSLITRYEVLCGLKAKSASRQLADFDALCARCMIPPIGEDVIQRASELYALLKHRGTPICDADILIAATALIHDVVLVTSNTKHFTRIPELRLDCRTTA